MESYNPLAGKDASALTAVLAASSSAGSVMAAEGLAELLALAGWIGLSLLSVLELLLISGMDTKWL